MTAPTPCTGTLGLPGPPLMSVGSDPLSIVAADLDGNGKPDLAVANRYSNTVSVLVNQSNGTFAPKVNYATGYAPTSVAAADLTGEGKPDLAVASGIVSVLVNQGNGTFAPKVDYVSGHHPQSIAAADLTGDGRPDLAVAHSGSDSVSVLVTTCLP